MLLLQKWGSRYLNFDDKFLISEKLPPSIISSFNKHEISNRRGKITCPLMGLQQYFHKLVDSSFSNVGNVM